MSNLINCKACNKEISKNAKACPHCGEPLSVPIVKKKVKKEQKKYGFLTLILAMFLIYIVYSAVTDDDKTKVVKEKKSSELVGADFYSMTECLNSIRKKSGSKTIKPMTDTPNNVSGYLSNGKQFGCKKKTTGTKGTYYNGWYYK